MRNKAVILCSSIPFCPAPAGISDAFVAAGPRVFVRLLACRQRRRAFCLFCRGKRSACSASWREVHRTAREGAGGMNERLGVGCKKDGEAGS